jgi:mono/diheme cytochrome c family protein
MTEIPEHLLARSRARREAAGLATPGDAGAAPAPSAGGEVEQVSVATPAPAAAAAPPPPPPPPKPDPPYIQAYKNRKKIPVWAMPALALLPLWAFVYANTLEKPAAEQTGPLAVGEKIYQNCATCHGASGEGGGNFPAFQNGVLGKDWPNFVDQMRWVSVGSAGWPGDTYGANSKPKKGGMPAWHTQLTPLEIAEVVRYEREVLSGLAPEPDLVAVTEGQKPVPIDENGNPVAAGT